MRAFGLIDGERKQVTVLLADLSGFTALSERLDAEEVAEITHAVLKELAGAVYEFRGDTVDARTDVLSLCVTMWEALMGERPFAGATLRHHGSAQQR